MLRLALSLALLALAPGGSFVDDNGSVVDGDGEGELVVSALSCMRGYWDRDDDTAACINVDDAGLRWYRTGDVVRRRGDLLVFAGRRDNQVKVRGVRIEVEAIEHVVCSEPSVAQALAMRVDDHDGMGSIRVWAVPAPGEDIDARRVIRWCRGRLPAAAVPTAVIGVDALPVTPNGKLDRIAVASWPADPPAP